MATRCSHKAQIEGSIPSPTTQASVVKRHNGNFVNCISEFNSSWRLTYTFLTKTLRLGALQRLYSDDLEGSGMLVIIASVVRIIPATDPPFSTAFFATRVGSIIPI